MDQEYFMGLDLGTGSVGWAVTDSEYELARRHGKALWGVRLFDSANTAAERRIFRTSRRRLARRNWRIDLLQEIFAENIHQADSGFYLRMKESRYTPEDKRDASGNCPQLPYALFVDADYTDKDYHAQFPTIYHLRHWLMTTEETPDIRLVYLALHHMMKHRGHFLFQGNVEAIKDFQTVFSQFIQSVKAEELDFNISIDYQEMSVIEEILKDRGKAKSVKKTELIKGLKAKTSCEKAILNLIVGGTVQLSNIFGNSELDSCERPKISFSDSTYDEYKSSVQVSLGEQYEIIEMAKSVYDWAVLADILGEHVSLSEAKIEVYEKHKKDLLYLKKLVRESFSRDTYRDIFVKTDEKLKNYSTYIGMAKNNGRKRPLEGKCCDKEEFYSFLKKTVAAAVGDEEKVRYLREEMEKGSFLPRQVTKDNGTIPYQVHLYELDRIIENLNGRIPLLREQGDKIRKIFTFRIPYYVGPLNGVRKGGTTTNWARRKKQEKIYPWNFKEVIDEEGSAEEFIRRMTNKCTYLLHEDVLPKQSMLYSKFMVLNELNNLRLDGEPITVILKQRIYEELFQQNRKVTQKKLKKYLVREGIAEQTVDITGIDGDFKGTLTAYHDFKEKLTGCQLSQPEKENIILNITLFGEDKKLLMKRLEQQYPSLSDAQRKGLCALSYKGWGRLSEAFLEKITAPAPETGEAWSIIRTLWETNDNLMQILSEKYQFAEAVNLENEKDENSELSYKTIDQLYLSPAVKRQVWQTVKVVKEICQVMGKPPKRIFIEMAREKQPSQRTVSRKMALTALYQKCKEEERDWFAELEQTEEHRFRSDKLYLYYTQKGRCMYSGENIELGELYDNNKYDIDHIYPQSKVMDDSLENRVLVRKTYNAKKTDIYPVAAEIRRKMQSFWKELLAGGFITKEKYGRLARATEFESSELAGFIARQLVETRQSTKAVASILKQVFPETEIVYSKAKITSQFRQDFNLLKVREMNDLHHAKDAYLNIVVGNAYYTKFTNNPVRFIKENPGRTYHLSKLFTSGKDVVRNGEIAWKAGDGGTISTVKRVMKKNNILVTRRPYQVTGGLFDQQLMKKGKGQVPIKSSDERLRNIEKYGGYNKATGAYFMLVESENKKGGKIRTIEYVPLYLSAQLEQDEHRRVKYLEQEHHLINPIILLPKIKVDTLFKIDGFFMWLSGRAENQLLFKGATQLLLSEQEAQILKKVIKFVNREKKNKNIRLVEQDELSQEDLLRLYDAFLNKIQNTVYGVRLKAQEKTLSEKRGNFLELGSEEKCKLLFEILHIFQCQSGAANLTSIGGPKSAGILKISHDITKCKQISVIHQSPTGIYEQEIDLQKI